MSGQEKKIESILLAAVEIQSESERTSYLDRACEGDGALRDKVAKMVADHIRAGDFLERPAVDVNATEDPGTAFEKPGASIGRYKVLQVIGEGGFGVVYMAEQREPICRKVAVKVIKPGMDTRNVIARFEAERQALALMDHPNIAKVLDAGTTDAGHPFFVMELIKGVPLTDYCDRNKLTLERRLELFSQICRAVQHAHQKGIIHRDIKPGNVLVTLHDGQPVPKVIDFGIAKATDRQLTQKTLFTQFGQMIGTPAYMSPEQAEMSGLDTDTRSDVYSLGVLLYELLTGTTPFDPDTIRSAGFREMQRIITEEEPPCPSQKLSTMGMQLTDISDARSIEPGQLNQLVRGELDWIVMKTLEKDRNRRYDTPGHLAIDVERFLANEPVEAGPPSAWYRMKKVYQRHRATVTAIAVSVVALLIIAVASSSLAVWAYLERVRAERAMTAARMAEADASASALSLAGKTDELRREKYPSDILAAHNAYRRGDTQHCVDLLTRNVPAENEGDLRGIEWDYLWNLSHAGQKNISATYEIPPVRLGVGKSTSRIAVAHRWGYVSTIDSKALSARSALIESTSYAWHGPYALSHDGQFLAFCDREPRGKRLVIHNMDTDEEFRVELDDALRCMIALPDDGMLALAYREKLEIRKWSDGQLAQTTSIRNHVDTLAASPTGSILVGSHGSSGKLQVWDLATLEHLASIPLSQLGIRDVAVSHDGAYLAAAGYDSSVYVLDAKEPSFPIHTILTGHTSAVFGLSFSSSGNLLASCGRDTTIRIWEVDTGVPRYLLRGHTQAVGDVHFLADGDSLVSCGDTSIRLWRVSESRPLRSIQKPTQISEVQFINDRELFFYEYRTPVLTSVDVESWQEEKIILDFPINALGYSPHLGLLIGGMGGHLKLKRTARTFETIETGTKRGVSSIRVSPDGKYLAVGTHGDVRVWAVRGEQFHHTHTFDGLAWSVATTNELVAHGDNTQIVIHALDSGSEVHRWTAHKDRVIRLAFSRDGQRLLSCSLDGKICVWNKDGECLSSVVATARQWCVDFVDNDRSVFSTGDDGFAVLRDPNTLEATFRFPQLPDGGLFVTQSPGGRWLAASTISGVMKVWDLGEKRGSSTFPLQQGSRKTSRR